MGTQQPGRGPTPRRRHLRPRGRRRAATPRYFRFVAANCSWTASERTIESYIASRARADDRGGARSSAEVFAESLARKQRLFARASTGNQLKTALAVQNSIDRMFGDFAGERDELSDVDRFLEAMLGAD